MRSSSAIILGALFLGVGFAAHAQSVGSVYRWIDGKGVVHYGDRPVDGTGARGFQAISKESLASPDNAEAQKKLSASVKASGEAAAEKQKAEVDLKKAQSERYEREKACLHAREAFRVFATGGRMTTVNEKGEKVFMEDQDVKQKQEEASKSIEDNCSPPKTAGKDSSSGASAK